MEDTMEVSQDAANAVDSSNPAVTTSLVEYRTYGQIGQDGKAKGYGDSKNPSVLSATQTGKNWEAAEKAGGTILNKNSFKFYTLTDPNALSTLVPEVSQQLYVIQKGLDAIQTAAANRLQTEFQDKKDEKNDPDVFLYNEETIDLREAINRPPEKKNLSVEEKFARAVSAIPQDQLAALIAQLQQKLQA